MIDEKGNPVSVKTYPYIGGSYDYIHFKGDDSWWVKERTCRMSRDLDGLSRRWWRCSDCDGVAPAPDKFSFCPYCGARVVSE